VEDDGGLVPLSGHPRLEDLRASISAKAGKWYGGHPQSRTGTKAQTSGQIDRPDPMLVEEDVNLRIALMDGLETKPPRVGSYRLGHPNLLALSLFSLSRGPRTNWSQVSRS